MGYVYSFLILLFLVSVAGSAMHVVTSLAGKYMFMFPVVYTVAMYTLAIAEQAGWSPWTAFGFGLVNAVLFGFILAFLERRLSRDSFAVLGVAGVFAGLALSKSWTSVTNGVLGISGVLRPESLQSLGHLTLFCFGLWGLVLILEWVLLRTALSRRWRAMREAQHILEGTGVNAKKLSFWTLVVACCFLATAAMPFAWFYQYVDPGSTGGLPDFIRVISVVILARQPKVSHVVGAAFFIVAVPELLRFLDLPASMMGPLRSILYSTLLIVALFVLQKRSLFSNRQI
ncbi:hypothetical protein IPG41_03770 [Candidatus Peregrinibacteria bacterium]|nr:MAG: hypothetical protein IPG41_03770 [Candidatus Peregrinibacteria bacterium]